MEHCYTEGLFRVFGKGCIATFAIWVQHLHLIDEFNIQIKINYLS